MDFDFGIVNVNDQITDSLLNDSNIVLPKSTDKDDLKPLDDDSNKDDNEKDEKKEPVIDVNKVTDTLLNDDDNDNNNDDKSKNTPLDNSDDNNVFESLSTELINLNIFTPDENEDGEEIAPTVAKTPEEFKERFVHEVKKQASNNLRNFLSKFGEDRQELFNAIFVNGVEPSEYIPKYNELQDLSNLDLTQESNQEQVVREYYKRQGMDEARIAKKIQNAKDLAELEDEAKFYHEKIVSQDKANLAQQEQQKQAQLQQYEKSHYQFARDADKMLRESLNKKEFEGIPLSEKTYQEAVDYITTPKWRNKSGELVTQFDVDLMNIKNPENLKQRIIVGLLAKNNYDLSKIKTKAITKESNELFSTLVTQKTKSNPTKNNSLDWTKKL